MVWSDTFRQRSEVLSWMAARLKGQEAIDEAAAAGPTFDELAGDWLEECARALWAVARQKRDRLLVDHPGGVRTLAAVCAGTGVRLPTCQSDR